jgi:phosphomannomutase/phosphoglucomutase
MFKLFGTAGVRGKTNVFLTPQLGLEFGLAFGSRFQGLIAVARDPRYGAEMIQNAVVSGLCSAGCEVHDLGMIPLPAFARWVADYADGGVMVTGSHIPPDQLGLVGVDTIGRDLSPEQEIEIERIFADKEYKRASWNEIHDVRRREDISPDPMLNYSSSLEGWIDISETHQIGWDPANGCFSGTGKKIMEKFGIGVQSINDEAKKIPNRKSEPRSSSLGELKHLVKTMNLDLGAGSDVDGDRVVFIDEQGTAVSEDVVGAIFAENVVKKGGKLVTPVNSSLLIEDTARRHNFEIIYCKVGPPAIAQALVESGSSYAYEESGKYLFPPHTYWSDALLSALKLLEIMEKKRKTLSELVAEFPKTYQIKHTIPIEREEKTEVQAGTSHLIMKNPPDKLVRFDTLDGFKIFLEDGWLLIRVSGTENVVRVYSDAKREERAKKLVEYGEKMVNLTLKKLRGVSS